MMRDRVAALVAVAFALALATGVNVGFTCLLQWAIEGVFDKKVLFLPLFIFLMVLTAIFGGRK